LLILIRADLNLEGFENHTLNPFYAFEPFSPLSLLLRRYHGIGFRKKKTASDKVFHSYNGFSPARLEIYLRNPIR
jgi:hypothetical protein